MPTTTRMNGTKIKTFMKNAFKVLLAVLVLTAIGLVAEYHLLKPYVKESPSAALPDKVIPFTPNVFTNYAVNQSPAVVTNLPPGWQIVCDGRGHFGAKHLKSGFVLKENDDSKPLTSREEAIMEAAELQAYMDRSRNENVFGEWQECDGQPLMRD